MAANWYQPLGLPMPESFNISGIRHKREWFKYGVLWPTISQLQSELETEVPGEPGRFLLVKPPPLTPEQQASLLIGSVLLRNQVGSKQWDTEDTPYDWYNFTYFPAVVGETAVPYAVIYCSSVPSAQAVGHLPSWVPYTVATSGRTVNVDRSMLFAGDHNCEQALISALNLARPANNSYLFLTQAWGDYAATETPIAGASLGLAVACCIMGAPPAAYTGFTKNVIVDIGGVNSSTDRDARYNRMTKEVEAVSKLSAVVEDVQQLGPKIQWAIANDFPLVLPHGVVDSQQLWDRGVDTLLNNSRWTQSWNIADIGPFTFSMAQMNAGHEMYKQGTKLLIATTVTDAVILAVVAIGGGSTDSTGQGQQAVPSMSAPSFTGGVGPLSAAEWKEVKTDEEFHGLLRMIMEEYLEEHDEFEALSSVPLMQRVAYEETMRRRKARGGPYQRPTGTPAPPPSRPRESAGLPTSDAEPGTAAAMFAAGMFDQNTGRMNSLTSALNARAKVVKEADEKVQKKWSAERAQEQAEALLKWKKKAMKSAQQKRGRSKSTGEKKTKRRRRRSGSASSASSKTSKSSKSSKSSRTSRSSKSSRSTTSSRGANARALKKAQEGPVWFKNVRKQHKTTRSKKRVVPDADASEEDDMKYLKSVLKPKKMSVRDKKKMSGITGHEKGAKNNSRVTLGSGSKLTTQVTTLHDQAPPQSGTRPGGLRWSN